VIPAAVFLVSLSTLCFEILLTRIFALAQWHHLSFMVISIALFGFAAAGTLLALLQARGRRPALSLSSAHATRVTAAAFAAALLFAHLVLVHLPLDYFRLPLEPLQALYLLAAYMCLALPFFFSGLVIIQAYTMAPQQSGRVYFFTMSGSAAGALLPALLMPILGLERLVALSALLPLAVWLQPAAADAQTGGPRFIVGLGGAGLSLAVAAASVFLMSSPGSGAMRVHPGPYKALSQALRYPRSRIVRSVSTIRGRIDDLSSPYIRFAPGLSLRYTGSLPHQSAVFADGERRVVLYDISSAADASFARQTQSFVGYELVPSPEHVLVILETGGLSVACALASGAGDVTIVQRNPVLARRLQSRYHRPVIRSHPRAYLAASVRRFDVIHVEDWGYSIPGSDALRQDHLFTVQAFAAYRRHLSERGVLIISRRLLLPPSDSLRMWAAAYESLKARGVPNPGDHLLLVRNWDTYTLVMSARPLTNLQSAEKFIRRYNFDLVFSPKINPEQVNRFNVFDAPFHYRHISRLARAYARREEQAFFDNYILDVAPQGDDRPFPGRFLKWRRLKSLYRSTGSRLYALLLSGETVIAAVLVESLLVAVLLLVVPLIFAGSAGRRPPLHQWVHFFGLGAGFMLVELAMIKRCFILFGDAAISFTVVVTAVLVSSAIGGLLVQKNRRLRLVRWLTALVLLLGLYALAPDRLLLHLLALSMGGRLLSAVMLLLPPGFLMGIAFPAAMRDMAAGDFQRAYGWAANGCASVLAAVAAAQVAVSYGITALTLAAAAAYLLAALTAGRGPAFPRRA